MSESRGPSTHDVPDHEGFADPESEAGVDAILHDDALLDALGRGELPASYRDDVAARLLTGWREDLDDGLLSPAPMLLATVDTESTPQDDTEVLSLFRDDTTPLPVFTDPDRIDESVRSAFVAAGYARPAGEYPTEPTPQLPPSFDEAPPPSEPADRRSRRRRLDRVVVAVAATAAIVAAGSAGSVAAAATAHPGDRLWPISRVIYAERARSIVASEEGHASLEKAREAIRRGDPVAARRYLEEAQEKLDTQVREGSDEADELAQELQITATLPEFRSPYGDPRRAGADPSTSGGATTGPSPRSRWERNGDPRRGPGSTSTTPSPGSTPSTAPRPTDPAPTTEAPTQGPTEPGPTPSEPGNTPDPQPTETISNGGSSDGQSGDQVTGADAGSTAE
ncbi:hypothetical protein [Cryptosporangium aurantiacum]|uniref:Anti-sigma-D factor RsdA to sigma factor binding region n=1 Tax=Cryptosporangium aurantiacum TaxID=134849 RepID=A0A1M7QVF5_9ACTN|nr:hypothetical protein [Cryptosporangium aurantiacum]SHN35823.1 hypothetical protein SAMN05443668_105443 [Cryptosporangium aurantiacum]